MIKIIYIPQLFLLFTFALYSASGTDNPLLSSSAISFPRNTTSFAPLLTEWTSLNLDHFTTKKVDRFTPPFFEETLAALTRDWPILPKTREQDGSEQEAYTYSLDFFDIVTEKAEKKDTVAQTLLTQEEYTSIPSSFLDDKFCEFTREPSTLPNTREQDGAQPDDSDETENEMDSICPARAKSTQKVSNRFIALQILIDEKNAGRVVSDALITTLTNMQRQHNQSKSQKAKSQPEQKWKPVCLYEISDLLEQEIQQDNGLTERTVLDAALAADKAWVVKHQNKQRRYQKIWRQSNPQGEKIWRQSNPQGKAAPMDRIWHLVHPPSELKKAREKFPARFAALQVLLDEKYVGNDVDPDLIQTLRRMFETSKHVRRKGHKQSTDPKVVHACQGVGTHDISDLLKQEIQQNNGLTEITVLEAALVADQKWVDKRIQIKEDSRQRRTGRTRNQDKEHPRKRKRIRTNRKWNGQIGNGMDRICPECAEQEQCTFDHIQKID